MDVSRRRLLESLGATTGLGGLAGCTLGRRDTCPSAEGSLGTTLGPSRTGLGALDEAWPMRHNDAAATGYIEGPGPRHDVGYRRLFAGAGSYFPSVVIGNGRVYVASRRAELLALDPTAESVDWRYEQAESGDTSAAVTEDFVLVASPNGLHAIDSTTGDRQWRLDDPFYESPRLLVEDGTAYASGTDDVVAVDVETGEVNWRVDGWSLGAVADGRVYVGVDTGLQVVDVEDGRDLWHNDDDEIVGEAIAVRDGTVYVDGGAQWGHLFRDPGRLYALDATDGNQQWAFQNDESQGFESLAVSPDVVAVGTGYGSTVHVLERQTGQQRWCAEFGSRRIATVAITDDAVYVVAGDVIQGRRVDDGTPLWTKRAAVDERLDSDDEEPEFYHHQALGGDALVAVGYGRQGLVVDAFLEQ